MSQILLIICRFISIDVFHVKQKMTRRKKVMVGNRRYIGKEKNRTNEKKLIYIKINTIMNAKL